MPTTVRQSRPRRSAKRVASPTKLASSVTLSACPDFDQRKHRIITDLVDNTNDISPKGSVDAPIISLVDRINATPHYYTTSSCSGRISLFQHYHSDGKGKSGQWLLCEHGTVTLPQLQQALHTASTAPATTTASVLRFEPFILSIACRTLAAASLLLSAALQSGCRESGITSAQPNRPVMVSVRCSIRMELPVLSDSWEGLGGLSERYVGVVWERLNGKMADNIAKIARFEQWFGTLCEASHTEAAGKVQDMEGRKEAEWSDGEGEEERDGQRRKVEASQQEQSLLSREERKEPESEPWHNSNQQVTHHVTANSAVHTSAPSHLSIRHSQLQANITSLEACLDRLLSTLSPSTTPSTTPSSLPCSSSSNNADDRSWCLLTLRQHAKSVREACKALDWNDTHRKVTPVPPHLITTLLHLSPTPLPSQPPIDGWMALPLNDRGEKQCRMCLDGQGGMAGLCDVLELSFTPLLLHWTASPSLLPPPSPSQRLQQSLRSFLQQLHLPAPTISSLLSNVPHKWEQLGDLVLLPSDAFTSPAWSSHLSSLAPASLSHFYSLLLSSFRCQRLARQQPVTAGLKRSSAVQLLVGDSGWSEHRENGVLFQFDVTRSMFASGNGSEKARLIQLVNTVEAQSAGKRDGEVVLDLYAGIGYFSLPLLVHTHVSHIYLCEHNLHTFDALTRSLAANNIPTTRYTLHPGDNRRPELQAELAGKVDRVLLGLLPSSEDGWSTAVKALNANKGGWMHVHANVRVGREDEWVRCVQSGLEALVRREAGVKSGWLVRVAHVEHVKSFAPLVKHLVADVHLGPTSEHPSFSTPSASAGTISAIVDAAARYVYRTDGIASYDNPSTSQFWATIYAAGLPALLHSVPIGNLSAFTPSALLALPSASCPPVSVHICPETSGRMDFVNKNYTYRTLDFHRFLLHATHHPTARDNYFISPHERYYLRSLGSDPRREVADVRKSFPELARSFVVPELLEGRAVFSSVLRVSSAGLSLWTHYDIVPNLLCHLHGVKRVTLFPPSASPALQLPPQPHSSSSPLLDLYSPSSAAECWRKYGRQVLLRAGDVLFIPPLWFHHVETIAAEHDSSTATGSDSSGVAVSINVFWRGLSDEVYTSGDVYGNKDVVAGVECMRKVEEAVRQLSELPAVYKDFYIDRAVSVLHAAKTTRNGLE